MTDATIEAIVKRSLRNCHAIGVDSLVLTTDPMVRVFVAHPTHTLWMNKPPHPMSVGFHPHHCDVVLAPIFGRILNLSVSDVGDEYDFTSLNVYRYESPILGKSGRFTSTHELRRVAVNFELM